MDEILAVSRTRQWKLVRCVVAGITTERLLG